MTVLSTITVHLFLLFHCPTVLLLLVFHVLT